MKNKQVNFNIYSKQYQRTEFINFCNQYDVSFDEIKSTIIDGLKDSGEFNFSNEDFSNIQNLDQLYDFCQVNFAAGFFSKAIKKFKNLFKSKPKKTFGIKDNVGQNIYGPKAGRQSNKYGGKTKAQRMEPKEVKPIYDKKRVNNRSVGIDKQRQYMSTPEGQALLRQERAARKAREQARKQAGYQRRMELNKNTAEAVSDLNRGQQIDANLKKGAFKTEVRPGREAAETRMRNARADKLNKTLDAKKAKPNAAESKDLTKGAGSNNVSNNKVPETPTAASASPAGAGAPKVEPKVETPIEPKPQAMPGVYVPGAEKAVTEAAKDATKAAENIGNTGAIGTDLKKAFEESKTITPPPATPISHPLPDATKAASEATANGGVVGTDIKKAFDESKGATQAANAEVKAGEQAASNAGAQNAANASQQAGSQAAADINKVAQENPNVAQPYFDKLEQIKNAGSVEEANRLKAEATELRKNILNTENAKAKNKGLWGGFRRDAREIGTFGFGDWWRAHPVTRTLKLGAGAGATYAGGKAVFGGNKDE